MLIDYPLFAAPLSHVLLTVYNIAVYLSGILFLISGCFVNNQRYLLYDLYVDSFALSLMLLVMIGITAGILLVDVSFYKGSLVDGSCQIIGLSALMLLICTFELSAFLSGTLLRSQVESRTRQDLLNQLNKYTMETNITTGYIDYLQQEIKCCGVDNITDWKRKFPSGYIEYYPDSCCKSEFLFLDCGKNISLIYTKSCMEVLTMWMSRDVLVFSLICFGLCLLQIMGIVGLCLVQDQVESRWSRVRLPK